MPVPSKLMLTSTRVSFVSRFTVAERAVEEQHVSGMFLSAPTPSLNLPDSMETEGCKRGKGVHELFFDPSFGFMRGLKRLPFKVDSAVRASNPWSLFYHT